MGIRNLFVFVWGEFVCVRMGGEWGSRALRVNNPRDSYFREGRDAKCTFSLGHIWTPPHRQALMIERKRCSDISLKGLPLVVSRRRDAARYVLRAEELVAVVDEEAKRVRQ